MVTHIRASQLFRYHVNFYIYINRERWGENQREKKRVHPFCLFNNYKSINHTLILDIQNLITCSDKTDQMNSLCDTKLIKKLYFN